MEEKVVKDEKLGQGEIKKSPFPNEKYRVISEDLLKWIAVITMFIDHFGMGIIEKCYYPQMKQLDDVLRGIGRLAFPIYCFLLVEGYTHTHSRWKYLRNLGILALISEIPFDYLNHFSFGMSFSHQNVFFTLFLGMVVMMISGKIEEKGWEEAGLLLEIVVCIGIGYIAEILKSDYKAWGVILIFLIYICRNKPRWVLCLVGALYICTWKSEIPGIISFVLILFCNGKRTTKINKYVFYSFYPAHLALYCGIRYIIMK